MTQTLDTIIENEVEKFSRHLANVIIEHLAGQLTKQPPKTIQAVAKPAVSVPKRKSTYVSKVTEWVADKNAKRVPHFVTAQTGLEFKADIIAKYGEGATFKPKDVPKQPQPAARMPVIHRKEEIERALHPLS